jgi:hypothetical protein
MAITCDVCRKPVEPMSLCYFEDRFLKADCCPKCLKEANNAVFQATIKIRRHEYRLQKRAFDRWLSLKRTNIVHQYSKV